MKLNLTSLIEIERIEGKERIKTKDKVIREIFLTIFAGERKVGTLLCTPTKVEYLAAGFLFTQGIITGEDKIKDIWFNPEKTFVQVITDNPKALEKKLCLLEVLSASSFGACSFYNEKDKSSVCPQRLSFKVKKETLFAIMQEFQEKSGTFLATGGSHSCGLHNGKEFEVFAEDIGRHNAVDKVIGECFLEKIKTEGKILVLSGRVSREILKKVEKTSICTILSPSAPTDLAVKIARKLDLTLAGFVRGRRMNIYSGFWRVI